MAASSKVIFCSICGFGGFSILHLLRHFKGHPGVSFRCGVDDCSYENTNIASFRKHLLLKHGDIYPEVRYELPEFINSCFSSKLPHNLICDSQINLNSDDNISFNLESPSQNSNSYVDKIMDQNCRKFIEILLSEGCSKSVPFKHIKNLSASLIKYFSSLFHENTFTADLEHQMLHLIHDQEIFNSYIESDFNAVFHEMVNISDSNDFFAYIPLHKSLFKIIAFFSSFDEIFNCSLNLEDNLVSMPCVASIVNNFVNINIFIDDFQLCNPLMSKKSQKNSVTGIYYRIISSNKFKFSGKKYIYLLGLCHSQTFKTHSEAILQYIAKEINKLIDNPFPVTIRSQTVLCRLNIGYFSLDSKSGSFLLGMKQSFNHNYCCRFCIEPRDKFKDCFYERSSIRDQDLYLHHLSQIHYLENENYDMFGLQRFSPLRHFRCQNYFEICPPCIGHDIFEGICPKIFDFSIRYFINQGFFTYQFFINKVKCTNLFGKDKEYFPKIEFDNLKKIRFTINEGRLHSF